MCYGLSLQSTSQPLASTACQNEGASLVDVLSLTEHSYLNHLMDGYNEYWVGLTHNGLGNNNMKYVYILR